METFWSKLLDYLGNNYPWMIVVVVAISLTWLVARFYFSRFVKLEKKVNGADYDNHSKCISEHSKNISETAGNLKEINEILIIIKTLLIRDNKDNALCLSTKNSPRVLNEYGKKLLEDCKGEKYIKDNIDMLVKEIDSKRPQTALDVETESLAALLLASNGPSFNEIKDFVYNYPKFEIEGRKVDVSISDVCFVMSIPLRDYYIEKHTEIEKE